MRILLILIFIGFSLGAMATLAGPDETAGRSTGKKLHVEQGTLSGAVSAVRKAKPHLPDGGQEERMKPVQSEDLTGLKPGEALPKGTELYEIPRHESYRYAVIEGHRVIVDAASHRIIYVLR